MNAYTKKHVRRRGIKRLRLVLFFLGIGIAIAAWFLENATSFRCILRHVAPDYVVVQDVLEILDKGEKEVVSIDHPGAQVLLSWWEPHPPAKVLARLSGIGRSTGLLDLPNAKQFYEVRLLADNNTNMLGGEFVWKDIDIRARMEKSLDYSTIKWSATFFGLGLLLSVGMTLWEYFDK